MSWGVRRLNADATWILDADGARILFDPWLTGSEVDGARWFHEAWHTAPVVAPAAVPPVDVVVVSQVYSDHLHAATLAELRAGAAVVAVPEALRHLGPRAVPLPAWGEAPVVVAGVELWRLSGPWWRLPRYHAVVVRRGGRLAVHAPHGLVAPPDLAPVDLLAVSRVEVRLPWFLGGVVNPGPEAAERAARATRARHLLPIHDEDKRAHGLVPRVTRRRAAPPAPDLPWREVPVGELTMLEGSA